MKSDVDAAPVDPRQALVKQYGMPDDCREWRQFLVDRDCPEVNPTNSPHKRNALLPSIIWVRPCARNQFCSHPPLAIHPSSARAVADASGVPLTLDPGAYIVCTEQGRWVE